jgi:hypothetical protein
MRVVSDSYIYRLTNLAAPWQGVSMKLFALVTIPASAVNSADVQSIAGYTSRVS